MRIPESILDTVRRAASAGALVAVVSTAGAVGAAELIATDPVTGASTASTPTPAPTASPTPSKTAPIVLHPPRPPRPRPTTTPRDWCPPCGMG